jgi:hypothetical protein
MGKMAPMRKVEGRTVRQARANWQVRTASALTMVEDKQVGEDEGQAIGDEVRQPDAGHDAKVGEGQAAHRIAKALDQPAEDRRARAESDQERQQNDGEREISTSR